MVDTPAPIVANTIPPTHDYHYHPDHPGSIGTLIHALHLRLVELEVKLGLREEPKVSPTVAVAPVAPLTTVEPAVATPVVPSVAPATGTLSGT